MLYTSECLHVRDINEKGWSQYTCSYETAKILKCSQFFCYEQNSFSDCPLTGQSVYVKNTSDSTPNMLIKGLEPGTFYSVCIQAQVGGSAQASWSEVAVFATAGFGGSANRKLL